MKKFETYFNGSLHFELNQERINISSGFLNFFLLDYFFKIYEGIIDLLRTQKVTFITPCYAHAGLHTRELSGNIISSDNFTNVLN